MKRTGKYGWPDDPEDLRHLDDGTLLKLWTYAPRAKTDNEVKCSLILCDELTDRGLK